MQRRRLLFGIMSVALLASPNVVFAHSRYQSYGPNPLVGTRLCVKAAADIKEDPVFVLRLNGTATVWTSAQINGVCTGGVGNANDISFELYVQLSIHDLPSGPWITCQYHGDFSPFVEIDNRVDALVNGLQSGMFCDDAPPPYNQFPLSSGRLLRIRGVWGVQVNIGETYWYGNIFSLEHALP